jgi:D-alanyl-D-alanine carboxypeptidase
VRRSSAADDQLVLPRPALTVVLLLLATVFVTGAMAWPRATDGGDHPPIASRISQSTTLPATTASVPAPRGLDPGLVAAFHQAVAASRRAGHRLTITSGYRTVAEQEALLADAIAKRGYREAYRWVFPPARSMHVRGLAVDVGDKRAAAWLDDHGATFGLCRTLAWEWWHFEWRGAWEASSTCPRPVDDPADAPM